MARVPELGRWALQLCGILRIPVALSEEAAKGAVAMLGSSLGRSLSAGPVRHKVVEDDAVSWCTGVMTTHNSVSSSFGKRAFMLRQRLTPVINRYEVVDLGPDGKEGGLLGLVEQKRFSFKEKVTLFADETRDEVLATMQADRVLDAAASYRIADADGTALAVLRKMFKKSLLRSTFELEFQGRKLAGRERSGAVAVLRRISQLPGLDEIPLLLKINFDFHDVVSGDLVLTSDRTWSVRDVYTVRVEDHNVDWRVAAVTAIALDAFMAR